MRKVFLFSLLKGSFRKTRKAPWLTGITLEGSMFLDWSYLRKWRSGLFEHSQERRIIASKGKQSLAITTKGLKEKRDCMCFKKDESETISENIEHVDLVSLDPHVSFNLDELLKASAFVLGKSEVGTLYKVVLEDGLILAVRRLGEGRQQSFKEFQNEVEAIGRVRHPNIVRLRAYYWSLEEKLLIYDYIPNGNLSSAIHGLGPFVCQSLSWETRLQIIRETAKALSFLHEFSPKKHVHGELKPTNILLGPQMQPYISDFGVGRVADIATSSPPLQTNGTTLNAVRSSGTCYQAPEALRNMKPSQKWDVYSYGVILLELISGRSPVVLLEASGMELVRWVQLCIEEKKPISAVVDPYLACERDGELIWVLEIALACVRTNPERRPSMKSVLDALQRLSNARQRC
ncbi:hypothetical protein HPP92_009487 [Vanilla planifolia]|uniref:Protein kinase domain-containing protein n=1 Tax=Vanilla planifolia TaxID=51239 RepID=A0A835RK06_VANPL|nr:hypothetical protein HPP92_009487 [Vanilla planifolia]